MNAETDKREERAKMKEEGEKDPRARDPARTRAWHCGNPKMARRRVRLRLRGARHRPRPRKAQAWRARSGGSPSVLACPARPLRACDVASVASAAYCVVTAHEATEVRDHSSSSRRRI